MSSDSRTRRDELERPTGAHELIAMETSHADIEDRDERAPEEGNQHQTIVYLQGWRLHSLTFALCLGLFLSTIETTIVSTTLVAITNSLNGFQKNNWIVTSYLLTYAGFLIILSKLSDYFGRKPLLLLTVFVFTVFSAACGAAQSFEALVVMRALQGIGGGGIYTLIFTISLQMVPPEGLASLSAIISAAYACSAILGPTLGGLISDHTTWRWIFYMNVAPGVLLLVWIWLSMPANFPYGEKGSRGLFTSITLDTVRQMDFLGAFLLLAASVLMVSALEEGGTQYSWKSATVLTLFCMSVLLWIIFFSWQKAASKRDDAYEPVLPWRLLSDRITMGFILNAFFGGAVFIVSVIIIPQRFQVVNDLSAFGASWRLLALMLCSPVGTVLSGLLVTRVKVAPLYIFLVGAILQTIGLSLMGTLSVSNNGVPSAQYGYQVLLGLGIGLTLSVLIVAAPLAIEEKDTAVFVGAITQARILGGSIGLAVCTNILNTKIESASGWLSSKQLSDLLQSAQTIKTLPPNLQQSIRQLFGKGYNEQMQVMTAFGGAAVLAGLMMWEKQPRKMH